MSDYTKITSVEQLKSICTEETQEFFIWLGIARSSKSIAFDEDMNKFYIHNEIDDTEQFITPNELFTKSNIGDAITGGNFWKY